MILPAKPNLLLSMPLPGRGGRDVIDEYLECLIAPLVGVVPYPERTRLREETAFHLERLQDDYRSEGLAAEDAARQAVDDYGSSRQIADDFLESWFRKSSDRPLSRRFGHGSVIAFTTFALAQTVCVAIFQARIYLPSNSALSFAVSPAWFNEIFPPSVTVPEFTPLYALMILAALVSPILAGAVVGRSVPIHAARAAYQALLPCILFTFVSGVLLLPAKELLIFAVLQTVYWLPAGALSAALVSLYIRQRRCRYGGGR